MASKQSGKSDAGVVGVIGFGSVLAIVISWTSHQALLWALLHGLLGWFYVIYYLLVHDGWTWL